MTFRSTSFHQTTCKTPGEVPNWIDLNMKKLKGICQFNGELISLNPDVSFHFDEKDGVLEIRQKLSNAVQKNV